MRGKHGRRESDVVKVETYNSMKNQLEMENAALMRERMNIQQQSRRQDTHTPSNYPFAEIQRNEPDFSPIQPNPAMNQGYQQGSTVDILRSKIFQIINICQGQGDSAQLHEVAEAERQVLSFLDGVPEGSDQKKAYKQIETPVERSSKKKKSKLNKTSAIEINKQSHYNILGDQAIEMIQQIERKALVQIENLRADKITLMKKLNAEVKAHNQEKKLRSSLESKVKSLTQQLRRRSEANRDRDADMEIVDEESDEHLESPGQDYEEIQQETQPRPLRKQPKSFGNVQDAQSVQASIKKPVQAPQSVQAPQPVQIPQSQRQTPITPVYSPKGQTPLPNPLPNGQVQAQAEIAREIERLQKENQRIKLAISGSNPNLKNQLRSQLAQLEQKIQFYQQNLNNRQRSNGNVDLRQLETLLNQANNITEEGNKLLKTKKIPEYRTTMGSYESQENKRTTMNENTRRVQERQTMDYTRPPLQTFSPMDKSYHSQTYKGGFSPTKYENLIQEMNQATKI